MAGGSIVKSGRQDPRSHELSRKLPRDVGAVLLVLGTTGLVIPGPIPPGTVFVLGGVVLLCPRFLGRFGQYLQRRWPRCYRGLIEQIERFGTDLERRYPGSTRSNP